MKKIFLLFIFSVDIFSIEKIYKEQDWGIGAAIRSSHISYTTEEKTVNNLVPLLFFT